MVKHSQTIRQLLAANCLNVFNHFVGLALKLICAELFLNVAALKISKNSMKSSVINSTHQKCAKNKFLQKSFSIERYFKSVLVGKQICVSYMRQNCKFDTTNAHLLTH